MFFEKESTRELGGEVGRLKGRGYPNKSELLMDRKNPRWIRQGVIRHFLMFMV